MQSMQEVVTDPARRADVVRATESLIDTEVASQGGLTGMAIKGGYKVVKKLQGGRMIPAVVDGLLDEFVGAIEPLHAQHRENPTGSFGSYLQSHSGAAANALLGITDARAQRTSNNVLKKTYGKLRPFGEKNVKSALPGVGNLIDRFCA
ncbi:MAG: hypothetical protein ACI81R_001083 [Bradymonadia bacterium]|jgi:hypothetical protein